MNFKTKPLLFILFFLFNAVVFSSCSFNKSNLFYAKKFKKKSPLPVKTFNALGTDTLLKEQEIVPGNLLSIRNLQNETGVLGYSNNLSANTAVSSDYRVENDGTVTLPFLGKIFLAGFKTDEAEKELNKLYAINLLKDPLIKIKITNLSVTVLGEFNKQGNILLNKSNTHLTEIIGDVGGVTNQANLKEIKIIRGDFKNPTVILVNLNKIESLNYSELYIRDKDIIYASTKNSSKLTNKINDAGPVIGIISTILSLYLIIDRFN